MKNLFYFGLEKNEDWGRFVFAKDKKVEGPSFSIFNISELEGKKKEALFPLKDALKSFKTEIEEQQIVNKVDNNKLVNNLSRVNKMSDYTSEITMTLQIALHKLGYDPGRIDGVYRSKTQKKGKQDSQTMKAVKKFQKENGLTQDGWAGENTLSKLCEVLTAEEVRVEEVPLVVVDITSPPPPEFVEKKAELANIQFIPYDDGSGDYQVMINQKIFQVDGKSGFNGAREFPDGSIAVKLRDNNIFLWTFREAGGELFEYDGQNKFKAIERYKDGSTKIKTEELNILLEPDKKTLFNYNGTTEFFYIKRTEEGETQFRINSSDALITIPLKEEMKAVHLETTLDLKDLNERSSLEEVSRTIYEFYKNETDLKNIETGLKTLGFLNVKDNSVGQVSYSYKKDNIAIINYETFRTFPSVYTRDEKISSCDFFKYDNEGVLIERINLYYLGNKEKEKKTIDSYKYNDNKKLIVNFKENIKDDKSREIESVQIISPEDFDFAKFFSTAKIKKSFKFIIGYQEIKASYKFCQNPQNYKLLKIKEEWRLVEKNTPEQVEGSFTEFSADWWRTKGINTLQNLYKKDRRTSMFFDTNYQADFFRILFYEGLSPSNNGLEPRGRRIFIDNPVVKFSEIEGKNTQEVKTFLENKRPSLQDSSIVKGLNRSQESTLIKKLLIYKDINLKKLFGEENIKYKDKTVSGGIPLIGIVLKPEEDKVGQSRSLELENAKYLVEEMNADVNQENFSKQTALMIAAKNNYPEVVRYLLSKGADKDKRDINGKTAFEYAFENNNEAIQIILKRTSTNP